MKLNTVDGKAYLTLVIFCDKVCWWKLTEHRCFHPGFLVLSTNKTDTHDLRVTKILIKYYDLITGTNLCSTNNGGCEQLCLPTPGLDVRCECADGFQPNGSSCINIGTSSTCSVKVLTPFSTIF